MLQRKKKLSLTAMNANSSISIKSLLVLFVFAPFLAIGQKKLAVSGNIKGLKEGSSVFLADVNKPADTLAKGVVRAGKFSLKGQLEEPALLTLSLDNGTKRTAVFFDNSTITIAGDGSNLKALSIKGSPSHDAFDAFQKKFNPLFERLGKVNEQMQFKGRTDSLNAAFNTTKNSINKEIDLFIKKYKSSAVSSFLLAVTMQLNDDILETEARLNSLLPAASNNFYGKYLRDMIAETKITAIGSVAAEFTQTDTLGKPVSLSSFRGKYVLLDFWASWCGPCRQENPTVVQNYHKFKDKNFTVLGVSLDRPGQKAKWLQAIHADNLTWTHVSDLQYWNNAIAQQYRVQSIPQNFLIGPDGKILARNLRGPDLEMKLCEVLGCN
ncbi:MAG: AhpC/TSA family protein [Chitinophagaceae bacterium]|nr:AhpC/TSA family protein [Chitinophagaceae bacterium]